MLGVGNCEFASRAVHLESAARDLNASRREIDARYASPATRELKKIGARSKTNFKQTFSGVPIEAGRLLDPRRVFVAIAFNCIEVFATSKLVLARNVGSAWIRTPLRPSPLLSKD
jgi:hypothetical protein